jgi:hypothetical protein
VQAHAGAHLHVAVRDGDGLLLVAGGGGGCHRG